MKKHREYYLLSNNEISDVRLFSNDIHVIEYAACRELQAKLDKAIETLRFVRENFLDIPCDEPHEKGMLTTGRIQIKRTLKELEG